MKEEVDRRVKRTFMQSTLQLNSFASITFRLAYFSSLESSSGLDQLRFECCLPDREHPGCGSDVLERTCGREPRRWRWLRLLERMSRMQLFGIS